MQLTAAVISVLTYPGEIELTRMPYLISQPPFTLQTATMPYIFCHLLRNGRTHGPNSPLGTTVRTAELTFHRNMTRHAGYQDNTAMLGLIGDHLPGGQLRRVEQSQHIDFEQVVVVFEFKVEKGLVTVDAGTGDADVQGIGKVGLEGGEAGGEGFGRGHVHSVVVSIVVRP